MANEELLKSISELLDNKLEARFEHQKGYIDARLTAIDSRFNSVDNKLEAQKDYMDSKFTAVDARLTAIDSRFTAIDSRFNSVDNKFEHQKDYIDSRLVAMEGRIKKDILDDISKFHVEVISDIGQVDEKISQISANVSAQALVLKRHETEIQTLKRKVG